MLDRWARAAGLGYLMIVACGMYAEFFVRQGLVVPGDPSATANAIAGAEALWRSAIASELVMLLADVLVAGALYVVFRGVSEGLAMLAAFFRLAHAAVVGVNLLNVYVPLLLLGDAARSGAFVDGQRDALALLLVDTHAYGYAIGLTFFGVYCGLVGWLVLRSAYVPRVLGVLLLAAGAGYLIDSFARTLMVDYAAHADVLGTVVLLPAFVGELSFSLWLIVKGVRVPSSDDV
jgi:hypothetical protein